MYSHYKPLLSVSNTIKIIRTEIEKGGRHSMKSQDHASLIEEHSFQSLKTFLLIDIVMTSKSKDSGSIKVIYRHETILPKDM
jgi:hypothetical protein